MIDRPLAALSLAMAHQVPFWYSLTPLQTRPGLRLVMPKKTWLQTTTLNVSDINASYFQLSPIADHWIQADFPFKIKDIQNQQRTLACLLNEISITNREVAWGDRCQLAACDILRSVPEMKGYLMTACISHELKLMLRGPQAHDAITLATQAMKNTARYLKLPWVAKYCFANTSTEGFLDLGVSDGSGSCFCSNYLDRGMCSEMSAGYRMDSDNVDDPRLQLVFLSGLAAIIDWGERQTQTA